MAIVRNPPTNLNKKNMLGGNKLPLVMRFPTAHPFVKRSMSSHFWYFCPCHFHVIL